jgi:hypothetical protein
VQRFTSSQKLASAHRLQRLTLPDDPIVYSILRHTSRSTCTRIVDFFTISDNKPWPLSACIATIVDAQRNAHGQLILTDTEGRDPVRLCIQELIATLARLGMPTNIHHIEL